MSGLKIKTKDLLNLLFPGLNRETAGVMYSVLPEMDYDCIERNREVEQILQQVSGVTLEEEAAEKCEFCEGDGKVHAGSSSKVCPKCYGTGLGEEANDTLEERIAEWFRNCVVVAGAVNDLSISLDCGDLAQVELEPEINGTDCDCIDGFVKSVDKHKGTLDCYGSSPLAISKGFLDHGSLMFFNKEDMLDSIMLWNKLHGKKTPMQAVVILGPDGSDIVEEIISIKTGEVVYTRSAKPHKHKTGR